jgi:hypothetical protein
MAFLAYFDASGSGLDPKVKVISVGGFVAHESVWATFEAEWRAVLQRFGVNELHMRDYAHSRGEFTGWEQDRPKRDAFMQAITRTIREGGVQTFGASLPLALHRLYNQRYCLEETIGPPYAMAAMAALASGTQWRDHNNVNEPISFFVEKGDNQQTEFRRYMETRIHWGLDDYNVSQPIFLQKRSKSADGTVRCLVPFQACDFIAYEQAKALTDLIVHRKRQVRQSLRNAIPSIEESGGRTYWKLLEQTSFKKTMVNFKVPQRFNHFRGNSRRTLRVLDPLCYVNSEPVMAYIYGDGYLKDES